MTIGHGSTGDYTYLRMLGRLGPCVVLSQLVLWTMCAAGADTSLQVVVSSETAPAGGTAQFKIYLAHSARIASGRIVMDFDPAIFGDVANVEVFSASADAYGAATVDRRHIDARFSSPVLGLAGPRDLPLFTVVVPILAVATTGATSVVTFSTGGTAWTGASGESYSLAIQPGQFTVKGALSISNVSQGGGLLAAGTVVEINGGGFDSLATLDVPGVSVSAVQVLGPRQILMTLDAPADLTGKRVRVRNPDGERAEYVSSLRGNLVQSSSDPALASIRPLMPRRTQQYGEISRSSTALALENSNSTPVDVVLTAIVAPKQPPGAKQTITIPAASLYLQDVTQLALGGVGIDIAASAPLRMLEIVGISSHLVTEYRGSPETSPSSVSLQYQTGTKLPDPLMVAVCSNSPDFTVSVVTSSGGDWLSAPAAGVSHCMADFPIMVNPSSLAPGVYSGLVAFSFAGHQTASYIAVSLVVSADPFIAVGQRDSLSFTAPSNGTLPASQTVTVSSSGAAARFTATPSFTSGASWFSVTPSSGITSETLTITTNPSGLLAGYYSGSLQISGPANTINLAVELKVEAPGADVLPTLQWSVQTGTLGAIKRQKVDPYLASRSIATDSGGDWLKVVSEEILGAPVPILHWINVSVDATGLAAGEYNGRITLINRDGKTELLPVRLIVWSTPPRLTVTPSSFTFTTDNTGNLPVQTLHVSSGGIPVEVAVSVQGHPPWFSLPMTTQFTPADFRIAALVTEPGTAAAGTVTIAGAGQTVVVPVTTKVTTTFTLASTAPLLAAVTNAASQLQGSLAPGEIISIFGLPLGPADPQVLFDGRPAQVLYSSLTQVNAIVPDSVAGRPFTMLEVDHHGLRSDGWGVPVVRAAPGIFTADSSGQGQAVALNEDNSLNSPANPARRGSLIHIFTTGVTDPVSATIAGVNVEVRSYSGNQVNVVVPPTMVLGIGAAYALPVVIMAGGARSQDGVTITVTL